MEEITIKRKDRNIDVIKEKMLEILDEYEEAKEGNNENAMIKLEGYFNKQKALMKDCKEYFDSYNTDDMKMQANYDTDIDNVREAKYILAGKKDYEKNSDLYNDLMSSKTMEEAKEALNKKPEKNRKFVFRKFKKQFIAIGLVVTLGLGALVISHIKKKNNQENNNSIETITEYNDDTNSKSIQKESNFDFEDKLKLNDFSNDNISVDESYKNLKYIGNGETISNYYKTNGVDNPDSISSIETKVTEISNENIVLPSRPVDTISEVIIPEQSENSQTNGSITEISIDNENKDIQEKVTIVETEEVPNLTENKVSEIEKVPTNTDDNNNEIDIEENIIIPPKSEENKPHRIEETNDDEIIYFDENGNPYTISKKLETKKSEEDPENEEKIIIEETEEVPSFEIPTKREEEKSSITKAKEQYIAIKKAMISQSAQNNAETEIMEDSQVLTYKM